MIYLTNQVGKDCVKSRRALQDLATGNSNNDHVTIITPRCTEDITYSDTSAPPRRRVNGIRVSVAQSHSNGISLWQG